MPRFVYAGADPGVVPDLRNALLQPGQEFDPAEFGVPDWTPNNPIFQPVTGKAAPAAKES